MKLFSRLTFIALLTILSFANAFADGSAPAWLKQAASIQTPTFEKDVPAVVLRDEKQISLDSGGKLVTTENYAVKILLREGKNFAIARAFYLASFNKVRDIGGWVIRPDGSVKEYGKKSVIDIISDPDDVYNEGRLKIIDASDDVDAGYVFGYTAITEDTPLFYQDDWDFQGRLPVMVSRYSLDLPSGWTASSITFNHSEISPQVNGSSYVWELRSLPPIRPEPMSPSVRNIAPRIAVNYVPNNTLQAANRAFTDWTAISQWATNLYEPQLIVDDAIAAKARDLTVNSKTELEKIRAVGNYVQSLQYIAIDIGVGYGNGMIPRPSNVVLNRGYGDCKDKANLMRAMLKALKIEAYPVIIYAGDPTFVHEEWVSPGQFNHCIIAVKVSSETNAATVINHPKLGRLLIFDATDPYTSVGDLPNYEQDSFALIVAGANGGLSKMPVTPPETDLLDRRLEVNLMGDGSIKGTIQEISNGQESTASRAQLRRLSAGDYNKMIEAWLTRASTGAQLIKMTTDDKKSNSSFDLNIEFAAPRYAQLMQNRLLVFKPVIVSRRNALYLTENKRDAPVLLNGNSMKETTVFTLPEGFVVDELPDAVKLETPFGKYSTTYEVKENKLFFTRSLTINRAILPVEKYGAVKDFYTKILTAEQSPVVLLKK